MNRVPLLRVTKIRLGGDVSDRDRKQTLGKIERCMSTPTSSTYFKLLQEKKRQHEAALDKNCPSSRRSSSAALICYHSKDSSVKIPSMATHGHKRTEEHTPRATCTAVSNFRIIIITHPERSKNIFCACVVCGKGKGNVVLGHGVEGIYILCHLFMIYVHAL